MPTKYRFVTNNDYVEFYDDAQLVVTVHKESRSLSWSYDSSSGIAFELSAHHYQIDDITSISFDDEALTSQADFVEHAEAMFPNLAAGGGTATFDSVLAESGVITEDRQVEVAPGKTLSFVGTSDGAIVIQCPEYEDNAAALTGGLRNGAFYCTNVAGEFIVKRCVD